MTFRLLDLPLAALRVAVNKLDLETLRSLSTISEKFKKRALFPLFRLPHFALKNVINQLDVCIVLYLTMTSSKFLKKVQRVRYDVDQLEFFHGKWYNSISYCSGDEKNQFKVAAYFDSPGNSYLWEKGNLNGKPVEISNWKSDFKVRAENESSKLEVLECVARHLLSIFTVTKFNIDCRHGIGLKNHFLWKFHKKIEKLTMRKNSTQSLEIPPEELNFVLREVNSEELKLDVKVPYYKYQGLLRGRKIVIRNSSWIDFNAITIDTNTVSISFVIVPPPFNYAGINRLIKNWMAGKNEKLEELDIQFWSEEHRDDTQIFEGIDLEESSIRENSLKNQELYRMIRGRDTLQDIERTTDGRKATIATDNYAVGLFPWKE